MKTAWQNVGKIVFWLTWPLLYIYLKSGQRTRVLVIHDDKILLVHNWHSAGKWALPGGGLKNGEDSKAGAIREVHEETGLLLEPDQLNFLSEGQLTNRGLTYNYISYYTKVNSSNHANGRLIEITDVEWVVLEQLDDNNSGPDILQLIRAWQAKD